MNFYYVEIGGDEMMATIYLYRLTYFGGTAPCYDNNELTLSICKRDMRRVIGRRIKEDGEKDIWIAGVLGTGLSKEGTFQTTGLDVGDLIYIARVDDVVEFHEYFTKANKRKDCIYEPCADSELQSAGYCFSHKSKCDVHEAYDLQERDWDVKHKNHRKYVLKSNTYRFLDKEDSNLIKKDLKIEIPKGVGHKVCYFDDRTAWALCEKGDGISHFPSDLRKNNSHGCGKRGTNL